MKRGLVLEGGALRGLFSAGVMDVLMENNIHPDGIIGVSAGAAFGCNIISKQPGRVIRYNKNLAHDWRYASYRSLLTTGDYFGGEYAYHYMPFYIDKFDTETFDNNPQEFWVVCTNVGTGKAHYQRIDKIDYTALEYIRASASMPLFAKVVNIDGKKYLDGGVSDSIPLAFFQEQGFERNIVVATQPKGYQKQPNKLMPLIRLWLHRYPRMIRVMRKRHIMYNKQLAYLEQETKKGNTFIIRPKTKLPIEHLCHKPEVMQQTYDLGRQAAEECLEKLKTFYNSGSSAE